MIDAASMLNFHGYDWPIIRAYLKEVREQKIGRLLQDINHDEVNKIRGALSVIDQLLRLETAAKGPQKE